MLVSQVTNIRSVFPWQTFFICSQLWKGNYFVPPRVFFVLGASLSVGHGWAYCSLRAQGHVDGTNGFCWHSSVALRRDTPEVSLGIQLLYMGMQGRCITSPGKGISNSLLVLEDSRSQILLDPRYLCNLEKFSIIRQILPSLQHFE